MISRLLFLNIYPQPRNREDIITLGDIADLARDKTGNQPRVLPRHWIARGEMGSENMSEIVRHSLVSLRGKHDKTTETGWIKIILYLNTVSYTLDSQIKCEAAWEEKGKGLFDRKMGTERRLTSCFR